MSENIKFIVDDLADITEDLMEYKHSFEIFPHTFKIGNEPTEYLTTDSAMKEYEQTLNIDDVELEIVLKMTPTSKGVYSSLLNFFVSNDGCDFIYIAPQGPENSIELDNDRIRKILNLDTETFKKVHFVQTNQSGSALHLLTKKVIQKYLKERSSVEETVAYIHELDSRIVSYMFGHRYNAVNKGWIDSTFDANGQDFLFKRVSDQMIVKEYGLASEGTDFDLRCFSCIKDDMKDHEIQEMIISTFPESIKNFQESYALGCEILNKTADLIYKKTVPNIVIDFNASIDISFLTKEINALNY